MIQDFKFAVRQLLKAPGFTIAAVKRAKARERAKFLASWFPD
jgi:hypothetical protein